MKWLLAIGVVVAAFGCGHATAVRPVPRGAWQPELGIGGPAAKVSGFPLPLPVSTAGARVGLTDTLDASGHLHLTSLVFDVAGLDVGSTWLALDQQGAAPAVALTGRLYGFTELARFTPRAYLEVTPAASWRVNDWLTPYVSASALVQFAGGRPLVAAGGGAEVDLGRFAVQAELRWYAPNAQTRFMAVDWVSPGGLGATGVVVGVRHRFGGGEP